jgi:hypothetical protein
MGNEMTEKLAWRNSWSIIKPRDADGIPRSPFGDSPFANAEPFIGR